jgi:5-methyltetrahydropteroyltriglutamate--homocysteine methyltransferase
MSDHQTGALGRLRVDHVGSLLAPLPLQDVYARNKKGEATDEELKQATDAAILHMVRKQESIGYPIVTDGELRRANFQESFGSAVTGFDVAAEDKAMEGVSTQPLTRAEQNFTAPGPAMITRRRAVERLKLVRNVPLEEYRFTSEISATPVKVTLLSPDRICQRFAWEDSTAVYADMEAFRADVIAIEREMIRQLSEAGCRYIQIDAPSYTAYVDQVSLDRMRARGEDPVENMERSIAADNAIIEGFDDVTFGIHLCRGNPRTRDPETGKVVPQWHREGHYDAIAESLFAGLNHQRLLLEYDDDRSGGFEPLRFVPKDKIAVLGLVTTKRPDVEPLDLLARRIEDASKHLPLDQLALSPQCGFGGLDHVVIPEDDLWRKLERILDTARRVWG